VCAVDLRGHGESDWPDEYTGELMRDDVLGFLDEPGLDSATSTDNVPPPAVQVAGRFVVPA
jgi:pimeloyl-ACP methyl ester carboxylesterase